jgi:hypothetical protein
MKPYFKPKKTLFQTSKKHRSNNVVCVNGLGLTISISVKLCKSI